MSEVILVCYCPGIDKRAVAAYKVQAKDRPVPPIYKGRYGIADFCDSLRKNNISGEIVEYARAISKTPGKFAYYMRYNLEGKVEVQYNLLTGKTLICSK